MVAVVGRRIALSAVVVVDMTDPLVVVAAVVK